MDQNRFKVKSNQTPIIVLILAIFVLAVFWNVQYFDFVHYDDHVYVTDHAQVRQGLSWTNLKWAMTSTEAGFWHPLTWLSLMLDFELYGLHPGGYHFTNLLLHLANTLLLFLLLSGMTGAVWRSALVAALFAVHPLHVESVAWIAERKDVLSALFWMLALGAYARYAEHPSWPRYGAVFLALLFGLMAKAMLVTLPFVLLLLDFWPMNRARFSLPEKADASHIAQPHHGKNPRRFREATVPWLILEKVPLILLSVAVGVMTLLAEKKVGALKTVVEFPWAIRVENAFISYVRYIGKMFWPTDLSVIYPHPGAWPLGEVALTALALVMVTGFALRFWRRAPYLTVGWFWYLGVLIPVIGLIQIGSHAMADRYTYIPLIGLFIMIAWGMADMINPWRYGRALLVIGSVAVVLVLIPLARTQVGYWEDAERLFRHAVKVTDRNYIAHNNLGAALARKGKHEAAFHQYRAALAIHPRYPEALFNAGSALAAQGRYAEAEPFYNQALKFNPGFAEAHNNLAIALAMQGRMDSAISHFLTALKIRPTYADAVNNLEITLRKNK